tara:strand:+ start:641 stop:895 length:255 start_codon:yes stop_codon:yes gene_type:complete
MKLQDWQKQILKMTKGQNLAPIFTTKNKDMKNLELENKELKDTINNIEEILKNKNKTIENLKLHLKLTEETLQDYREIANRLIK